jgi:hypothetical protein
LNDAGLLAVKDDMMAQQKIQRRAGGSHEQIDFDARPHTTVSFERGIGSLKDESLTNYFTKVS